MAQARKVAWQAVEKWGTSDEPACEFLTEAEAPAHFVAFAARLESCPDTSYPNDAFFSKLLELKAAGELDGARCADRPVPGSEDALALSQEKTGNLRFPKRPTAPGLAPFST
jgi:hypothetical protein